MRGRNIQFIANIFSSGYKHIAEIGESTELSFLPGKKAKPRVRRWNLSANKYRQTEWTHSSFYRDWGDVSRLIREYSRGKIQSSRS